MTTRAAVLTSAALRRWCATCQDEVTFEQPACIDDHEGECPEWLCVRCAEAFVIGFSAPEVARESPRRAGRTGRVA